MLNTTIHVTYGTILNGSVQAAGKQFNYLVYDGRANITKYTVNVTKAIPPLAITVAGTTISAPNVTQKIYVPILPGKKTYNLTINLSSSTINNNLLNYTYYVNQGGTRLSSYSASLTGTGVSRTLVIQNIPAGQNTTVTFDAQGNSNYSSVDPVAQLIPANVVFYVPLTITNTATGTLTANTQVAVPVNALKWQQYENSILLNVLFFNKSSGTVIPSWLAGNTLNLNQQTSLYTSANILFWIKLPDVIAGSSATDANVYMGFVPTNGVNLMSTTGNVGESPVISTTYAKYDNGNTVFPLLYSNFTTAGTGLPFNAVWTATGANVVVSSGLIITTPLRANYIKSNIQFTSQGNVFELFGSIGIPTVANNDMAIGWNALGVINRNSLLWKADSATANRIGAYASNGAFNPNVIRSNANAITLTGNFLWGLGVAYNGLMDYATINEIYATTQNTFATTTNVFTGANSLYIVNGANTLGAGAGTVNTIKIYYARIRTMPPNNIMPSITFGSLVQALNVSITNCANSIVDVSQSCTFTATEGNAITPYTANFFLYNSITNAFVTNNLFTGISATSNTWTYIFTGTDAGQTEYANVVIKDNNGIISNSPKTSTVTVNSLPSLTITSSNMFVDSGQTFNLIVTDAGGRGGQFTVNIINYTPATPVQVGASNVLIQSVGGNNGITKLTSLSTTQANTFKYNAIATDLGTTAPFTFNAVAFIVTVNEALGIPAITAPASAQTLDAGQTVTFTASIPGGNLGTSSYTYNWIIFNSVTNGLMANQPWSSVASTSNSYTFTSNTNIVGNTLNANVFVTDSANTPVTTNSVKSVLITIDQALGVPTLSASNSPNVDTGQYELFLAALPGGSTGTGSYAYNYIITNSITNTVIANQLWTNVPGSSNTFLWQVPTSLAGNTINANVIITDSATTAVTSNSVKTAAITVSPALASTSWVASIASIGTGSTQTLTATISGGTSTYSYNFLVYNSAGQVTNALYTGLPSTTNAFAFSQSSTWGIGTFTANLFVTDSASNQVTVSNTLTYTVTGATCTIQLSPTAIAFGGSAGVPSGTSVSTSNSIADTNQGSATATIYVQALDSGVSANAVAGNWISSIGSNSFDVSNTKWSTTSQPSYTGTSLSNVLVTTGLTVAGSASNTVYFGLNVPSGVPNGTFLQNINIENSC